MKWGRSSILEVGLLATALTAPVFFGSVYSWASMSLYAFIFFLLFLYPESISGLRNFPAFSRIGCLVIFSAVLSQILFTSLHRFATVLELVEWSAMVCVLLLMQILSPRAVRRFLIALVILGVLESIYGLWQVGMSQETVLWRTKESYRGFVTGTYFNRNHFAGLLEMCLGIHCGLWLTAFQDGKIKQSLAWGALFLVTATAFLESGSRMAMISLGLSLLFSFLLLWRRDEKKTLPAFLLSLLFLGGIALLAGRGTVFLRWANVDKNWYAWEGRWLVWQDTLKVIRDYPWLGTGLGSFEWIFPTYQSAANLGGWFHAHNDYLELAAELGLPVCLILFFSFAAVWWKAAHQPRTTGSSFGLVWGCVIAITSLALHSLADFQFAIPANLLIFICLLGAAVRLLCPEDKVETV